MRHRSHKKSRKLYDEGVYLPMQVDSKVKWEGGQLSTHSEVSGRKMSGASQRDN